MTRILIGILAALMSISTVGRGLAEQKSAPSARGVIEVHAKDAWRTPWSGFRAVLDSRGGIERIEGLLQGNKYRILPMTEEDEKCTIPLTAQSPRLIAEDLNFDGYLDLGVLCAVGATGYRDYSIWLWDPSEGTLRHSSDFSQILEHVKSMSVNHSERTVTTVSGDLRSRLEQTYAIVDGRPVVSYSRYGEITKDGIWEVTIRRREGERLVVVEKRRSRGDSPW